MSPCSVASPVTTSRQSREVDVGLVDRGLARLAGITGAAAGGVEGGQRDPLGLRPRVDALVDGGVGLALLATEVDAPGQLADDQPAGRCR